MRSTIRPGPVSTIAAKGIKLATALCCHIQLACAVETVFDDTAVLACAVDLTAGTIDISYQA
ncbi:hypothetical protein UNDKW_4040 [Undibacterium sp. KW1]|nr:hypothetical protein UNDKW_4040 [Undibacterium sp. KW1]